MSIARGAATALLVLFAGPAAAHVTLEAQQAQANATYRATFRVPHGCGEAATTRFIVRLPGGVTQARPVPKAGSTLRVTYRGEAASRHGAIADASEIVWEGGTLAGARIAAKLARIAGRIEGRAGLRPGDLDALA